MHSKEIKKTAEGSPGGFFYGQGQSETGLRMCGEKVCVNSRNVTLAFSPFPPRGGVRAAEITPELDCQGEQGGKRQRHENQ